jgi:peptidoglycan hydrolase-like protein with peptidoglycan-binding domain
MIARRTIAACLLGPLGVALLTQSVAAASPPAPALAAAGGGTTAAEHVRSIAAPVMAMTVYAYGARGGHVVELQRALIARGFAIPAGPTGYFGPQTRAAVAAYQRSQGWSGSGADGIPGPLTVARLGLAGVTAAPSASSTSVLPSTPSLPSTPTPPPPTGAWSSPTAFLSQYGAAIRSASTQAGIPPLVGLGQAALESGWGTRATANNFFGVKARPSDPIERKHLRQTTEVRPVPNATGFPEILSVSPRPGGGYTYVVRDWFRTYASPEESFRDHAAVLTAPRYQQAFAYRDDPYRFAAAIASAGYATDPSYTTVLHAVMRRIAAMGWS